MKLIIRLNILFLFLKSQISFVIYYFLDETPEVSPITSPSRSHSTSSPGSSVSSSPRSYQSHHSAQNSPPSGSSHTPITHYGLPPSISVTSHPSSNLVVKGPRTLAARKAYDEPLDVSIRRIENERFRGLMIHPYSRPASSHSPVPMTSEAPSGVVAVTPQDAPINLEVPKQSGGDNWRYITPPRQQVMNNGELTIVQHARAPSPPQDGPLDFSTKSKSSLALNVKSAFNKSRHGSTSSSSGGSSVSPSGADNHLKSFTSSRELKFAKNLKYLLVEILRKNPSKAKIIIRYMQHVWWKRNGGSGANGRYLDLSKPSSGDGIRQHTAANGQPGSGQYVQGGNNSSGSGGGSASGGAGSGGQGGPSGGSNGGGYGSGSGGSNGGGNGNNGNNRRPFGFGGNGGSNNNNNNNEDEKESGDANKSGNNPNNNSINSVGGAGGVVGGNSILDIGDLDFDDLPTPTASSTANWFSTHPEINTGKVINGLLNLKSEYPSYPSQNGQMAQNVNLEKLTSNDLTGLDNATANLLQMSVPDPSTTFLDIGTDIGGCASLYEDDPFNLEHLLPSNFNMNQLDTLSGNGNNGRNGSMLSNMPHGPHENSVTLTSKNLLGDGSNLQQMTQQQPQELTAISPNHSSTMTNAAGGLTITATSITTNTQNSLSSTQQHQQQNLPSSICASLYPETTISPVMGHRQNNQLGNVQQNPSQNMSGQPHQSAGVNMNANHLRNLEPIPPSSLKTFIKTEPQPINLPQHPGVGHGHLHHQQDMHPLQYIKKENNLEMQPPHHQSMGNQYLSPLNPEPQPSSSRPDMYDRTPGVSPTSMPSPGSPPISSSYKNMGAQGVAAMAIAALANGAPPGHPSLPDRFHFTPQMMMQGLQSPSMHSPSASTSAGPSGMGGGKMRGPAGPGGNRKRSSSSQCKDGDDDLSSVPSLQMRIKILQQRVCFTYKDWLIMLQPNHD